MATIPRDTLARPALPEEEVHVPALGGAVLVRGLDMPGLLRFRAAQQRLTAPLEGETAEQASERASGELVPLLLHECVLLDDGLPVYSVAEWQVFGAQHAEDTLALWNAAVRLNGQDAAAEKKP